MTRGLKKDSGATIHEAEKVATDDGAKATVTDELVIKVGNDQRGVKLDATGKVIGDIDYWADTPTRHRPVDVGRGQSARGTVPCVAIVCCWWQP